MYSKGNEKVILVMMDDDCDSPCFCYHSSVIGQKKISSETLTQILWWASELKPEPPELVFLVHPSETLPNPIIELLAEMPESIACTLVELNQQKKIGIPVLANQTVIVPNIEYFEKYSPDISGRPYVLHVNREDISKLHKILINHHSDNMGHFTLRPRELHLWDEKDFQLYKEELLEIALYSQRLSAAGKTIETTDIFTGRSERCPAGQSMLTIGPDGLFYLCPAFYYAGQNYSIGSMSSTNSYDDIAQQFNNINCDLSNNPNPQCHSCLFYESKLVKSKVDIFDICRMNKHIQSELVKRVAGTGYTFEGFVEDRTKQISKKSWSEGNNLSAEKHICDIEHNEFVSALKDIYLIAKGDHNTDLLRRWKDIPNVLANSRKSVFYKRVSEIFESIVQLKELNPSTTRGEAAGSEFLKYHQKSIKETRPKELPDQIVSEKELANILTLYKLQLGWEYILSSLRNGESIGLPGKDLITIAESKLAETKTNVMQWFKKTIERYHWPTKEGWIWQIDFETGSTIVKSAYCRKSCDHDCVKKHKKMLILRNILL